MATMILTVLIGIFICVLGGVNMTGNITSLHSYHRKRVREEDKKPFGRLVGIGSILMGLGTSCLGVFMYIWESTQNQMYFIIGSVIFGAAFVVGLAISFFAMIKYNKGIF